MPWVQSLVKELRFPQAAKKKKKCRWSRALKGEEELIQSGEELVGVQDVFPKVGSPQRVLEGETSMALR